MKIESLSLHPYEIPLNNGQQRAGALLHLIDESGNSGWGDISPLPKLSDESLEESLAQLNQKKQEIIKIHWTAQTCFEELNKLALLPSLSFGLESALLTILTPISGQQVSTSALLMGSREEILKQAHLRHSEGFVSAKLKFRNLSFEDATMIIHELKDKFRLRIDVNRLWSTSDSLRFFSQFPLDTFDYVEEPFSDPNDLALFPHPLAVDESFPKDISLEKLESLPTLKALIYKPTIQGGIARCLPLHEWAKKRGIMIVLSSSFESDIGLVHIASIAHRLSLTAPIGIGTYHHMRRHLCEPPLQLSRAAINIPSKITPKI